METGVHAPHVLARAHADLIYSKKRIQNLDEYLGALSAESDELTVLNGNKV